MADIEAPRDIKLKSSDGLEFSVPRNIIAMSVTLNTLIQELGLDDKDAPNSPEPEPLPLDNVDGATLKKVLEWCEHYIGQAAPPPREPDAPLLSEWETAYLNVSDEQLQAMTLAAHYLEIQGLVEVCCRAIANMIHGKSPDEMRPAFRIIYGFDP